MTSDEPSDTGPVRPLTAVALATVTFVALVIGSFGVLALVLGEDPVEAPGIGQAPGIAATVVAALVFGAGLWATVGRRHPDSGPSFWSAAWIALAAGLAYTATLWIAALVTGADFGAAGGAAGRIATSWFGVALVLSAFVCAWGGIALVRTRTRRPRWPWEDEEED